MKPLTEQLNRQLFRVWYRTRAGQGWRDVPATAPDGAIQVAHIQSEDPIQVYDVDLIHT